MTATLTSEQVTHKVILDNITWETYQRLMEERGECPKPRYAYDRGRLDIMVLLSDLLDLFPDFVQKLGSEVSPVWPFNRVRLLVQGHLPEGRDLL